MVFKCTAHLCPNTYKRGSGTAFYRFPLNPKLQDKWVEALKIKYLEVTKDSALCSEHFKPQDFDPDLGAKVLKPNAVPSVFATFPIYFTPVKGKLNTHNEQALKKVLKSSPVDCRLCSQTVEKSIPIFMDGCESQYEKTIVKHFPISFSRDDKLSKKLCLSCAEILIKFDKLVATSVYADSKLKQKAGLMNTTTLEKSVGLTNVTLEIDDVEVGDYSMETSEPIFYEVKDFPEGLTEEVVDEALPILCEKPEAKFDPIEVPEPLVTKVEDNALFQFHKYLKTSLANKKTKNKETKKKKRAAVKPQPSPECTGEEKEAAGAIPPSWEKALCCNICSRFISKPLRENKMKCILCGEEQISFHWHIQHLKQKHKQNNEPEAAKGMEHTCQLCGRKFALLTTALKHQEKCNKVDPCVCEICNQRFTSVAGTEAHYRTHGPIKCRQCAKAFFAPSLLREHLRLEHKSRFSCDMCGKIYSHMDQLKYHMQFHTGIMDYVCPICGNKYASANRFSIHLTTHSNERPFVCSFCPSTFKHPRGVYMHERGVHLKLEPHNTKKNTAKSFKCAQCPQAFTTERGLKLHVSCAHFGPWHATDNGKTTNFCCDICGKLFLRQHTLEIHKGNHNNVGVKKLRCQHCGKEYTSSTALYNHARVKHYPQQCSNRCSTCGKAFVSVGYLRNHACRTKKFKCEPCGLTFRLARTLRNHNEKEHSKENLPILPCNVCGAIFNVKSKLTRHKKSHR